MVAHAINNPKSSKEEAGTLAYYRELRAHMSAQYLFSFPGDDIAHAAVSTYLVATSLSSRIVIRAQRDSTPRWGLDSMGTWWIGDQHMDRAIGRVLTAWPPCNQSHEGSSLNYAKPRSFIWTHCTFLSGIVSFPGTHFASLGLSSGVMSRHATYSNYTMVLQPSFALVSKPTPHYIEFDLFTGFTRAQNHSAGTSIKLGKSWHEILNDYV
ncbi:hypothetical protein F5B19DRAFT_62271 [Rostrohypoxylon terebratum]|nr:hypothetical protein F5B19DRAFT_62271 [Rostrohypoxylon terebratum]